jgi:serine/threonine protein kinase
MTDLAGDVLSGRYRLGGLLGRGGMGEVRDGEDLSLGRPVAVKLLHYGLSRDERFNRRFENEARAAARLTHPNVVLVYDAGEHDGRPFIVMERLPGRTLADEIVNGPLPQEQVRTIGLDVVAALGAAHGEGIVHRDVKPSNVLLTEDDHAKVADFGIAKTMNSSDYTTTGTVIGTLAYLSPERLRGEPATPASDWYAVGVVLYEALAGRKPFRADNPVAMLDAMQKGESEPLLAVRPDLSPDLAMAIERAMAADAVNRFATADEFLAALSDVRMLDPTAQFEPAPSHPAPSEAAPSDPAPATDDAVASDDAPGSDEPPATAPSPAIDAGESIDQPSPPPPPVPVAAGGGMSAQTRRILVSLAALVVVVVAAVVIINVAGNGSDKAKAEPPPVTREDGTPVSPLEQAYVELQRAITP